MRKLLLFALLTCMACGESNETKEGSEEKRIAAPSETASENEISEKSYLCFLATGGERQGENEVLRDSTVLNLQLDGEVVTGNFNWNPAEKDSRRGVIQATKNGDEVKGNYAFMQEGKQDTIFIKIQLQDTLAEVTMLLENGEEIQLKVKRSDCR